MVEEEKNGFSKVLDRLGEIKDMLPGQSEETKTEEDETIVEKAVETKTDETEKAVEKTIEDSEETKDEGEDVNDKILKRLDALEQSDLKKDRIIEDQKKTIETLTTKDLTHEHELLVKSAITEIAPLDGTVDTEDKLMDALKKDFTEDEIKEDTDKCIKTYIKGIKIAKSKIPEGYVPQLGDSHIFKESDANKERAAKLQKKIEARGKVVSDIDLDED